MLQNKTKITIYDVAELAGVAISTVSRVINNSSDVSESTRAKVKEALQTLHFRPHRIAKALAQKQGDSIAIAIPSFTTPFHNELLKGIRSYLRDFDEIDMLLFDLGSNKIHTKLLNFLKRGAVDGLLLSGVPINDMVAQELLSLRSPVVLTGANYEAFDSFYWDDTAGARDAVVHLIRQGHRRIGMIRAHTVSDLQSKRVMGYRSALEEAGLPFDASLLSSGTTVKHAGFSEEAGYEAMQALLAQDTPPTAVFCSSDVQALGAWKAILDADLKVPDDIALVGYDDIKSSAFFGLTSVDQSMQEIGRRAIELLLQRMSGEVDEPPSSVLVTPNLQIRRSSLKTR